jgi:hypothetical protein
VTDSETEVRQAVANTGAAAMRAREDTGEHYRFGAPVGPTPYSEALFNALSDPNNVPNPTRPSDIRLANSDYVATPSDAALNDMLGYGDPTATTPYPAPPPAPAPAPAPVAAPAPTGPVGPLNTPEQNTLDAYGREDMNRLLGYGDPTLTSAADPLTTRSVVINGAQYTERDVLERARGAQVGDPAAEPFLNQARTILRDYGFRTGVLGIEPSTVAIQNIDERVQLVRGDSNTNITQLQQSAGSALATGATELGERYGVFTEGVVRRTMPDGTVREVQIDFDTDATRLARSIGVLDKEARAKTSWDVYSMALDVAFDQGREQIQFSGGWRPPYEEVLRPYFLQSNLDGLAGLSPRERQDRLNRALTRSQFRIPPPGQRAYSPAHSRGDALDINQIDYTTINRSEPAGRQISEEFQRGLAQAGARQVFGPWWMYGETGRAPNPNDPDGFYPNPRIPGRPTSNESLHYTHIHFGL